MELSVRSSAVPDLAVCSELAPPPSTLPTPERKAEEVLPLKLF